MADQVDEAALQTLIEAARAAGELALAFFHPGARTTAIVEEKPGGSPVTEADYLVDRFLKERLEAAFPQAGWLSEETADTNERLTRADVLIVDPIDGTRGYAAGDRRWAISIALVRDGRPEAGVVHAPALGETYAAVRGGGALLNGARIHVSKRGAMAGGALGGPRPLCDALARGGLAVTLPDRIPSLAYRMACVASGALDAALSGPNAADWDIAAADLIVTEAGGVFQGENGAVPVYNGVDPHHGALIAAAPSLHAEMRTALAQLKARRAI